MSASFRKIRSNFVALTAIALCFAVSAHAEDRMAGTVPVAKAKKQTVQQGPVQEEKTEKKAASPKNNNPDSDQDTHVKAAPADKESDQAQADEKPPAKKLDVDFGKLESIGLYTSEHEGSLGSGIWGNSPRSLLTHLLKQMPAHENSPTLQTLNQHLLLSAASTRNIGKDIDIVAGEDLFTLRLEKLIEIGAYQDAAAMYKLNKNDPYNARLARAGILATLYTGQKSLACLDTKASTENLEKDDFLKDFLAYCAASLGGSPDPQALDVLKASKEPILYSLATNPNYRFSYSPKGFDSLSELEQATIIAEHRLDLSSIASVDRNAIPPRDLTLLLQEKDLPAKQKFVFTLQSVKVGMLPPEAIYNMYEDMLKPGLGEDPKADRAKPATDWEMLPWLYNQAGNMTPGPEQWGVVKQAFNIAGAYGDEALIPFTAYISGLKPDGLNFHDIHQAFMATNAVNSALPQYWTGALDKIEPQSDSEKRQYYQIYTANYIAQAPSRRTPEQRAKIMGYLNAQNSSFSLLGKTIIENLDIGTKDINNAAGIYDKDFGLTSTGDYVMPSVDVWDRLYQASQNKNLGETVLLSDLALRGNSWQGVYPALLRDVLNGLNSVGLNEVSRSLAIEAVLGN